MQRFFVPMRDFSTKYAVMQSAMSSAERIFELLDQPVPIASPARAARAGGGARPDRVRARLVRLQGRGLGAARRVVHRRARGEDRAGRPDRVGQDDDHQAAQPLLRRRARARAGRRRRRARVGSRRAAPPHRRGAAGRLPVHRHGGEQPHPRPRRTSRRETAVAAARTVHADPFIRRLPRGYDEPVRERGNNLSVGQRQLLVVRPRARLSRRAILVLDEATSSVDTRDRDADPGRAAPPARAAARRWSSRIGLSTIEHADRILVLHAGELREIGYARRAAAAPRPLLPPVPTPVRRARPRSRRHRNPPPSHDAALARRRAAPPPVPCWRWPSLAAAAPGTSLRAGYEEARILWRREPIAEVLAQPDVDPADARQAGARARGARLRRRRSSGSRRRQLHVGRDGRRQPGRARRHRRAARPAGAATPGGSRSSGGCRTAATSTRRTPTRFAADLERAGVRHDGAAGSRLQHARLVRRSAPLHAAARGPGASWRRR